jgi:raffinose/stachyose/melibiose transport system permease protein
MRMKSNSPSALLSSFLLLVAVLIVIMPVVYVLSSSLKTTEEINRVHLWPSSLNWSNYANVFHNQAAVTGLWNSAVITVASLLTAVLLTSLAGYALGRRKERLFSFLYLLFLSAMMIPVGSNLVSLYSLLKSMHLTNTRTGLVLIYAAQAIPMGILLYSGFVKTIPKELDEAATIDGSSYWGRFFRIILPLMKPVTITFIVISAINIWNDFLMPLLFITSEMKRTLPLAVYTFTSSHAADLGSIYAMLTIAIVPPVLFFIWMQKYFFQGLTAGAVKG